MKKLYMDNVLQAQSKQELMDAIRYHPDQIAQKRILRKIEQDLRMNQYQRPRQSLNYQKQMATPRPSTSSHTPRRQSIQKVGFFDSMFNFDWSQAFSVIKKIFRKQSKSKMQKQMESEVGLITPSFQAPQSQISMDYEQRDDPPNLNEVQKLQFEQNIRKKFQAQQVAGKENQENLLSSSQHNAQNHSNLFPSFGPNKLNPKSGASASQKPNQPMSFNALTQEQQQKIVEQLLFEHPGAEMPDNRQAPPRLFQENLEISPINEAIVSNSDTKPSCSEEHASNMKTFSKRLSTRNSQQEQGQNPNQVLQPQKISVSNMPEIKLLANQVPGASNHPLPSRKNSITSTTSSRGPAQSQGQKPPRPQKLRLSQQQIDGMLNDNTRTIDQIKVSEGKAILDNIPDNAEIQQLKKHASKSKTSVSMDQGRLPSQDAEDDEENEKRNFIRNNLENANSRFPMRIQEYEMLTNRFVNDPLVFEKIAQIVQKIFEKNFASMSLSQQSAHPGDSQKTQQQEGNALSQKLETNNSDLNPILGTRENSRPITDANSIPGGAHNQPAIHIKKSNPNVSTGNNIFSQNNSSIPAAQNTQKNSYSLDQPQNIKLIQVGNIESEHQERGARDSKSRHPQQQAPPDKSLMFTSCTSHNLFQKSSAANTQVAHEKPEPAYGLEGSQTVNLFAQNKIAGGNAQQPMLVNAPAADNSQVQAKGGEPTLDSTDNIQQSPGVNDNSFPSTQPLSEDSNEKAPEAEAGGLSNSEQAKRDANQQKDQKSAKPEEQSEQSDQKDKQVIKLKQTHSIIQVGSADSKKYEEAGNSAQKTGQFQVIESTIINVSGGAQAQKNAQSLGESNPFQDDKLTITNDGGKTSAGQPQASQPPKSGGEAPNNQPEEQRVGQQGAEQSTKSEASSNAPQLVQPLVNPVQQTAKNESVNPLIPNRGSVSNPFSNPFASQSLVTKPQVGPDQQPVLVPAQGQQPQQPPQIDANQAQFMSTKLNAPSEGFGLMNMINQQQNNQNPIFNNYSNQQTNLQTDLFSNQGVQSNIFGPCNQNQPYSVFQPQQPQAQQGMNMGGNPIFGNAQPDPNCNNAANSSNLFFCNPNNGNNAASNIFGNQSQPQGNSIFSNQQQPASGGNNIFQPQQASMNLFSQSQNNAGGNYGMVSEMQGNQYNQQAQMATPNQMTHMDYNNQPSYSNTNNFNQNIFQPGNNQVSSATNNPSNIYQNNTGNNTNTNMNNIFSNNNNSGQTMNLFQQNTGMFNNTTNPIMPNISPAQNPFMISNNNKANNQQKTVTNTQQQPQPQSSGIMNSLLQDDISQRQNEQNRTKKPTNQNSMLDKFCNKPATQRLG